MIAVSRSVKSYREPPVFVTSRDEDLTLCRIAQDACVELSLTTYDILPYKIEARHDVPPDDGKGGETYGQFDPSNGVITIWVSDLTRADLLETLRHEFYHVYQWVRGLRFCDETAERFGCALR